MSTGALPGFRDFYPAEFAERSHIFAAWREVARRFAFAEYDGPPLETLELYTKKSGDEIVGQLYNFVDKGDRHVALRPEMTPTVARMVAARANALRKPVRWFSVPQLFRYERQQKGRLREHFQLNVDIFGEADVSADAELLAVAIEIMRMLGLGPADVKARVSDRRFWSARFVGRGVAETSLPALFQIIDKMERVPEAATIEKLSQLGLNVDTIDAILAFARPQSIDEFIDSWDDVVTMSEHMHRLRRYADRLHALGVADYVVLDTKIVRGLAYYTGIVFELFDAKGEFRAICGGGRYDNLLQALGGVDMPALGFGMGDVVLGDLLRARGLMPSGLQSIDFWVAPMSSDSQLNAVRVATALRNLGVSVEYPLREQSPSKQLKAAATVGAKAVVFVDANGLLELKVLGGGSQSGIAMEQLLSTAVQLVGGTTDRP
jgi:histidyl-tRNA synthetase